MKKALLLSAILSFMMLQACQNNGDIGSLFGSWRIDSYRINDEIITEFEIGDMNIPVDHVIFSFQNNIVNVETVLDNYLNHYSQFGTWSKDGDIFILDFTHYDADTESGTAHYSAPIWIGMTSDVPMVMTVSDNKKNSFTLTWIDPHGNVKVYKFHKTW